MFLKTCTWPSRPVDVWRPTFLVVLEWMEAICRPTRRQRRCGMYMLWTILDLAEGHWWTVMAMHVYECTCQKNCYTFVFVYVIPIVKLRGAQRSTFRLQLAKRETDLHLLKTPTRGDSQSSVPLRILRILRLRKYLVIFLVCYNKYLGSDPNRSSFIDCNNPLHRPSELSILD